MKIKMEQTIFFSLVPRGDPYWTIFEPIFGKFETTGNSLIRGLITVWTTKRFYENKAAFYFCDHWLLPHEVFFQQVKTPLICIKYQGLFNIECF